MARPRVTEAQDDGKNCYLLCWHVLQWRGGVVTMHCDNTAAVAVVNSGYSKVPEIMHLLRFLFFV